MGGLHASRARDDTLGFLSTTYDPGDFQPGGGYVVVRLGAVVLVTEVYSDKAVPSFTDAERQAQVAELAGQECARLSAAVRPG